MSEKIRVAIIGGQWGIAAHMPAFRSLPDYEVVAVCTSRRETAEPIAKAHDIPMAFGDWREMVKHPEIDLVDACVRPSIRTEMLLAAMREGKHVVGEVPHAMNAEEAKAMRDEAQRSGIKTYMAYEWQMMPAFRTMSDKVKEGFIGDPYFGHGQLLFTMYATPDHFREYLWQGDAREGANGLHNLAGSVVSFLRQCLNCEVSEIAGLGDTFRKVWRFEDGSTMTPDAHDTGVFLLRFENGFTATVHGGWASGNANCWYLDMHGSDGRLVLETPANDGFNANVSLFGGRTGEPTVEIPTSFSEAYRRDCSIAGDQNVPGVTRAFVEGFIGLADAIRNGGEAYPNFEDGYRVMKVCDAAIESYKTKQWITLRY